MKKWIRACTVMLAVGAVLCIGGAAAGGRLYSNVRNGVLRPLRMGFPSLTIETDDAGSREDGRAGSGRSNDSVWEPRASLPEADPDLADIPSELNRISSLKKLDFELGAGDYQIVEGEDYGLEYDGDWLDSRIENGTWRIRSEFNLFSLRGDERHCTITVPAGCTVEKLEWEIGAANVEVSTPIFAETADLEVGAGNLEMSFLDVSDKLDIEVGAGNLTLTLAGSWDDYRISAEVAMGTISLNGSNLLTGLAGSRSNGGGPRSIKAEAGMGNIQFYTENP